MSPQTAKEPAAAEYVPMLRHLMQLGFTTKQAVALAEIRMELAIIQGAIRGILNILEKQGK